MNSKEFIINYIQREYTITSDTDIMNLNYVEAGYVDSLGMIQFIIALEEEFGIEFDDKELENPDFKIVGKLIIIVNAKILETK